MPFDPFNSNDFCFDAERCKRPDSSALGGEDYGASQKPMRGTKWTTLVTIFRQI